MNKIVLISDTHGMHANLDLPKGDILIHAGDISKSGTREEVEDFLEWFCKQSFEHKIFIAGNHDFYLERNNDVLNNLPKEINYLNDSLCVVKGLKIWGSPITPMFYNWAFNRNRGDEIMKHWDLIPLDSDVIVTHGPAFRRLDRTQRNEHAGCKDLFRVLEKIKPKLHVFGHIHEGYGMIEVEETIFVNASNMNCKYELVNKPIMVEIQ